VNAIAATDKVRLEELEKWRALSVSTDY
jgi:hypothetical protein